MADYGFITPTGTDLISGGDDAITTNAQQTALALDSLNSRLWRRGTVAAGTDVLTLPDGVHDVSIWSVANSLVNKPPRDAVAAATIVVRRGENYGHIEWITEGSSSTGNPIYSTAFANGSWGDWTRRDSGLRTISGPANMLELEPADYLIDTYATSRDLTPQPPDLGGGVLRVMGNTQWRVIEWNPVGTTTRPKPIWRNEYNAALGTWYGFHRVDHHEVTPLMLPQVTVYGDSQSVSPGWPAAAAGEWSETELINRAYGGATSDEVLLRAGIVRPLVSVAGGEIPASGSVSLTSQQRMFLRDSRVLAVTVAGVTGALTHTTGDAYTFTRTTAGAAVPVPGMTEIIATTATAAPVLVVWFGGNDFNAGVVGLEGSTADHVIANYRRAIDWGNRNGRTVVVAGTTNREAAGPGTEGFEEVREINDRLRFMFPDRFLDVQAYYAGPALADAGLTTTPEDTAAMNAGAIPPSLFVDGVHLIPAAHTAIALNHIGPWLRARGYAW